MRHHADKHNIGITWHQCTVSGCDYKAKQVVNLRTHIRKRHGQTVEHQTLLVQQRQKANAQLNKREGEVNAAVTVANMASIMNTAGQTYMIPMMVQPVLQPMLQPDLMPNINMFASAMSAPMPSSGQAPPPPPMNPLAVPQPIPPQNFMQNPPSDNPTI
ncbi:hypothetical protein TrLO_g2876 [Triparma laevis f. longispina]|uniref:C2H2-type domain-containing protein n=1 Tax=Triparma laevis f. longispina TaxID=1714387 RepID=A0A9W7C878_9STRA|nr:hypothetical protein TrLO_g2876 [Triparma laevis f. longispina]